jgi:hypothetical protein
VGLYIFRHEFHLEQRARFLVFAGYRQTSNRSQYGPIPINRYAIFAHFHSPFFGIGANADT